MYTEGIRKIFDGSNLVGNTISQNWEIAKKAGYKAILHNGTVYVNGNNGDLVRTVFDIQDFQNQCNTSIQGWLK